MCLVQTKRKKNSIYLHTVHVFILTTFFRGFVSLFMHQKFSVFLNRKEKERKNIEISLFVQSIIYFICALYWYINWVCMSIVHWRRHQQKEIYIQDRIDDTTSIVLTEHQNLFLFELISFGLMWCVCCSIFSLCFYFFRNKVVWLEWYIVLKWFSYAIWNVCSVQMIYKI